MIKNFGWLAAGCTFHNLLTDISQLNIYLDEQFAEKSTN